MIHVLYKYHILPLCIAGYLLSFPAGPRFTKDSSACAERTLSAGETLSIEAEFLAYPPPSVKLTSETESQLNNERVRCTAVENKVQFVIQETKSEDSGKYGVVLENPFGMAVLGVKVNVLCEWILSLLSLCLIQWVFL